jgi:phosphoglycerate dehydrogenase-like enzyme
MAPKAIKSGNKVLLAAGCGSGGRNCHINLVFSCVGDTKGIFWQLRRTALFTRCPYMKILTSTVLLMSLLVSSLVCAAPASDSSAKKRLPESVAIAGVKINADDYQRDLGNFHQSDVALYQLDGWRKPKRILVTMAAFGVAEDLAAKYKDVEIVRVSSVAEQGVSGKFDAIIGFCLDSRQLPIDKHVRWVHSYSAGVEGCLENPAFKANPHILLTNSSGSSAAVIAEHAIGLMFSLGRGLNLFAQEQAAQNWNRQRVNRQDTWFFTGKTMLVLGLGSIGSEVAKRAHGLGMTVIATRNSSRNGPDYVDYVGLSSETLELAKRADVVVNALPLTKGTKGVVNAKFLQAMPKRSMLINVGRGGTVVTDDLVAALSAGDIAAAALDVTDPEPLPKNHPLWGMDNVIITPHIAAGSPETIRLVKILAEENIQRYISGDRLFNMVNRQRAY